MFCNGCGGTIPDGSSVCPICGENLQSQGELQINNYVQQIGPGAPSMNPGMTDFNQGTQLGTNPYQTSYYLDQGANIPPVGVTPTGMPPVNQKPRKVKKTKSKGQKFLTGVGVFLGILVAIVCIAFVLYMKSSAKDAYDFMQMEAYDMVDGVYYNEIDGHFIEEKIFHYLVNKDLNGMVDDYEKNHQDIDKICARLDKYNKFQMKGFDVKIADVISELAKTMESDFTEKKQEYSDVSFAINTLQNVSKKTSAKDTVNDIAKSMEELNNSRVAFQSGEASYDKKKYEEAIGYYKQVIERDENYATAQEKLKESQDAYLTQVIADTSNASTKEEYEAAIKKIEHALTVLEGNSELQSQLETLNADMAQSIKDAAIAAADQYIAVGDYASAFDEINDALLYNEGDADLTNYLTTSQSNYEAYISQSVAELVAADNYTAAIETLDAALGVLPDSTVLQDLQATTTDNCPEGLDTLKISESEDYYQITELTVTEDVVGNIYDPGNLFVMHSYISTYGYQELGYAKYYLNGKYTHLKGRLAVGDDSGKCETKVVVYGDNQILYCSDVLSRTTAPIDVDVDVTGIQWIQIVLEPASDANKRTKGDSYILFSNFNLRKN